MIPAICLATGLTDLSDYTCFVHIDYSINCRIEASNFVDFSVRLNNLLLLHDSFIYESYEVKNSNPTNHD